MGQRQNHAGLDHRRGSLVFVNAGQNLRNQGLVVLRLKVKKIIIQQLSHSQGPTLERTRRKAKREKEKRKRKKGQSNQETLTSR